MTSVKLPPDAGLDLDRADQQQVRRITGVVTKAKSLCVAHVSVPPMNW